MKWAIFPGPVEFSAWHPQAIARHLGNVSLQADEPSSALTIGDKLLLPLVDNPPAMQPWQRIASRSLTHDGEQATASYTTENKPLADYKAERKAALAAKRWEVETGGTTVAGMAVMTDRESQGLINGAYALASRNLETPGFVIKFKSGSGWVDLTAAQMVAIADVVGTHVQAAFANEAAIYAAIDAADTHEAVAAVDINSGW